MPRLGLDSMPVRSPYLAHAAPLSTVIASVYRPSCRGFCAGAVRHRYSPPCCTPLSCACHGSGTPDACAQRGRGKTTHLCTRPPLRAHPPGPHQVIAFRRSLAPLPRFRHLCRGCTSLQTRARHARAIAETRAKATPLYHALSHLEPPLAAVATPYRVPPSGGDQRPSLGPLGARRSSPTSPNLAEQRSRTSPTWIAFGAIRRALRAHL